MAARWGLNPFSNAEIFTVKQVQLYLYRSSSKPEPSQVLDAGGNPDGCGGHIGVYDYGGHGSQWFSLHLADQFEGNPSYDCPPTTPAPTTTGAPTIAGPTRAPATAPTTPPTTTAQTTTVGSVDECTEDGSNVLADEILVENLYDFSVMADDGSGKLVLQVRCILVHIPDDDGDENH